MPCRPLTLIVSPMRSDRRRDDLLDEEQPRMDLAVPAEDPSREEKHDVDQTDAEQRHERQIEQRGVHELAGDRTGEPHQRCADQREGRAIQAFRAKLQGLVARLPAQFERAAQ
jgi:hypothetical protein